jgi:iron complex transport system ATP-binding protein
VLRCEGLTLAVPGRVLARDVGFVVKRGDIWAVLGANGSGKTTLVHALAGLAPSVGAAISVDGAPLDAHGGSARAALVGILMQQEDAAFWGGVLEYVLLGRFPRARAVFGWSREDEDAARLALTAVGLAGFEQRSYRSLSGGERQRARIAQLLAQDPQLFLLDEPLQHLDLRHQVAVLRLFGLHARTRGKAVIMVLHDALWPAQACSHALLLHENGMIESGTANAMLTRDRLERLYGCPLREIAVDGTSFFAPV